MFGGMGYNARCQDILFKEFGYPTSKMHGLTEQKFKMHCDGMKKSGDSEYDAVIMFSLSEIGILGSSESDNILKLKLRKACAENSHKLTDKTVLATLKTIIK